MKDDERGKYLSFEHCTCISSRSFIRHMLKMVYIKLNDTTQNDARGRSAEKNRKRITTYQRHTCRRHSEHAHCTLSSDDERNIKRAAVDTYLSRAFRAYSVLFLRVHSKKHRNARKARRCQQRNKASSPNQIPGEQPKNTKKMLDHF